MNVFEKIIKKEMPAQIVYEDDKTMAFHDINPQAPIHILVIPKKAVQDIQCVDIETMGYLTKAIQEVAIKMGLDKTGYRIISNCGSDAGQEVFHLHFHILGGTTLGKAVNGDDHSKTDL